MKDEKRAAGKNILEDLDDGQRRAVLSPSRHALIVAPPGSGKTRVLSARFALLVKEGVPPEMLLAVTFTNRAAVEMKERIGALTGLPPSSLDVTTFHGFSLKLLKKTRPPFSLYGRSETLGLLKELGVKSPDKAARIVSAIKNGKCAAEGECARVLSDYTAALKRDNAIDLDDLVPEALKDLAAGAARGGVKSHIMVDEYQDINPQQARLVRLLAADAASVVAIGDPDQAIYSFRGASIRSFLGFRDEYADAEVVNMTKNYRSGANIVTASKELIGHNKERLKNDPVPVMPGGLLRYVESSDERAEADFIIKEIERLMGGLTSLDAGDTDLAFSDFAVLVRTNRQADLMAGSFLRSSLPYYRADEDARVSGDFIRRLKAATPAPGVALEEFIKEEARGAGLAEDLARTFVEAGRGFGERPAEEVLDRFIEEASLLEPEDYPGIKADRVSLLTLHMAKGLEFKTVFIAGFEDGLIPYVKNGVIDIEEERRLFYVGMTRAKERLYLVGARKRSLRGTSLDASASRFLRELPVDLVERVKVEKKDVKKRPVQKGLFD